MKQILALALALMLGGCSSGAIQGNLVTNIVSDAKRANELFIKYGDPAEQKCAAFLNQVIAGVEDKNALASALRAEETNGLLSGAAKSILIAQILRQAGVDQAKSFQTGFQANCSEVRAEVLALIMSRGLSTQLQ